MAFYSFGISETSVCGDIKMGFTVSKGQLEIDIVVVKGLSKTGLHGPPGKVWYVKYTSSVFIFVSTCRHTVVAQDGVLTVVDRADD